MTKTPLRRIIAVFATLIATIGLAPAQNSKSATSSKSGADPVKAATKPLTSKSAMPPAQHKGSPALPKRTTNNTNAELTQLERGKGTTASKTSAPAKAAPYKPAKSSPAPKIDYNYQKPAGGKGPTNSIH